MIVSQTGAAQVHTPHTTNDLFTVPQKFRLSWLHFRYLRFTIILTVAGDHHPQTCRRRSSLRISPMHLTPSQISSVGLQTGMTSLEITDKRHRALLQIPELALVVAGMGPRHLGVAFQALSPSGLRTNQVSRLSTTRLVLLVEAVLSQGVGVTTVVATLPITPVILKEVAVDSWPIVIQDNGVGGKDGGIGKR